jgi:hypothetical protein
MARTILHRFLMARPNIASFFSARHKFIIDVASLLRAPPILHFASIFVTAH